MITYHHRVLGMGNMKTKNESQSNSCDDYAFLMISSYCDSVINNILPLYELFQLKLCQQSKISGSSISLQAKNFVKGFNFQKKVTF